MLIFRVYLLIYLFFYFSLDCPTSIWYQCKTDTFKKKKKTKSLSFPFPLITKPSFKTQITVFSHNRLRKNPKQPNKKNVSKTPASGKIIESFGEPHHLSTIPLKNFHLFKIAELVINFCLKKISN